MAYIQHHDCDLFFRCMCYCLWYFHCWCSPILVPIHCHWTVRTFSIMAPSTAECTPFTLQELRNRWRCTVIWAVLKMMTPRKENGQ